MLTVSARMEMAQEFLKELERLTGVCSLELAKPIDPVWLMYQDHGNGD